GRARRRARSQVSSEPELWWLGARLSGEADLKRLGELEYLLEGAWVGGRNSAGWARFPRQQDVRGRALGANVSWEIELPLEPTLTFEYAFGSGDSRPKRGPDRNFRQTGLQSNEGRFDGVNYFHYYGELLQPELSNLQIWTAALGFPFWRSSSIEFVYHLYRQVHPAPFLRDTRIDVNPTGRKRGIGQGWDIVLGMQEWQHVEIDLIGSFFRAGSAYARRSGKNAFALLFKIDFTF
ncbi:MAG TPA: alginate export family protein, partial [Candidatus Eisenbacteria bacterium]|nr:alginate export family protein [Candidatus Eisenbacteria bacterium]